MNMQVDPNLVNQAYRQLLGETQDRLQGQVVTLQAAVTQLQTENQGLKEENDRLQKLLNQQSGRLDGVPQDDELMVPEEMQYAR
jgi:uncharacterized protein (DUF3084 family)